MTTTPTTSLTGRTAVVTGGAGPLGRVLADALATAGARIVVVDLDGESCAAAADGLPGSDHVPLGANLLDPQGISRVVDVVRDLGSCD
ncbi:MAG: SDR family NAD(P)-dependent oxidoreductase, partial [Terrabacter sp.]|nr:SDR family NAD(P)-dependent oxidoreductase [Terrabacter sp.]